MSLNRKLQSVFTLSVVASILAAGSPLLVADNSSPLAPVARARITSLTGRLLDGEGNSLSVGSELKVGDVIKPAGNQTASLVLAQAGTSSSLICIQPGSEVSFTRLSPSADSDYPLLDAELSLRSAQVRSEFRRVF